MKSDSSIGQLEPLVGEWEVEGFIHQKPAGRQRTVFEWVENGQFLRQYSEDLPPQPDVPPELKEYLAQSPNPVTAVIGLDDSGEEFTQLYADARGVFRVYLMSLKDGVWKLWREAAGFHQRFEGLFSEYGDTIAGRWESSEEGKKWNYDFDLIYSRGKP